VLAFAGLGDHSGQRVLLVGDSITEQSEPELEFGLRAGGWEPTVEGHTGSGIGRDYGVDWSQRLPELVAQVDPAVVIVELGSNDQDVPGDQVAADIDALMEPLRKVPRVVWANVQRGFLTGRTADVVNDQLLKATVRWPNLEVLDMSGHFGGNPEWLTDGLHLNQRGKAELGVLLVQALDAPPSRVGALTPVV
jgi:lysophospholipase L1-like esterase